MRMVVRIAGAVLAFVVLSRGAVAAQEGSGSRAYIGNSVQIGPGQMNQQRALATVMGRVTCSDTQRAARFATVTLIEAQNVTQEGPGSFGGFGIGRRAVAHTDIDGNFTVQAEPGDYYVTATAMGYASPVAEVAARLRAGASVTDLLASLPEIHVGEAGGATANITLDRGAVIAGKLQWDDGSPAAGVNVSVQSSTQTTAPASSLTRVVSMLGGGFGGGFGGFQQSDDRGFFRIVGLAPGSYLVRATVTTPSAEPGAGAIQRVTSIVMYAPGKLRRSDAEVVTVKSGEERDDLQFTLDLSALHTVSGHVSAADSGTIAGGVVRLTDTQDSSLSRMTMIQPDGSFIVQWVPAGNYTLQVTNASNMPSPSFGRRGQNSGSAALYAPFQESLSVSDSDVSGVGVTLNPANASQ